MDTTNSADETLSRVAQHLESFLGAWTSAPPEFAPHLPEEKELRRLALIEFIKADMELRREHAAQILPLNSYLETYPELQTGGGPPCELMLEEIQLRRKSGEVISANEYYQRYPQRAAELGRLMRMVEPEPSTEVSSEKLPGFFLSAGDTVDDFQLLVQLGKGAFGSVYLARQISMQRMVALKVATDSGAEPQTLAQLDHPNIVRVFDQRKLPEEGVHLLYMQYVSGGTLQAVVNQVKSTPPHQRNGTLLLTTVDEALESAGQIPLADSDWRRQFSAQPWWSVVCSVGYQLALALDYAHKKGVLHRDIKPANVLLGADASPKLADFNVSFGEQVEGEEAAAHFGGTVLYMSPEQKEAFNPRLEMRPEDLDSRSDLYSLGVMLWELLHGKRPVITEDGVIYTSASAEQGHFERVLEKCLETDRELRFASGKALAVELALCRQPQARKLLRPESARWRRWVQSFPVLAVLLAALFPNLIAGVFNFQYNRDSISAVEENRSAFFATQAVVNGISYPSGVLWLAWLAWPVGAFIRKEKNKTAPPFLQKRAMELGHYGAVIGILLWTVAGPAYPISLHFFSTTGLSWQDWLHFIASLFLCGLMAAAYPFFAITWLVLRGFLPSLVYNPASLESNRPDLEKLENRARNYFFTAGAVPLLALMTMLITGLANDPKNAVLPLTLLSTIGLLGLGLAYVTFTAIQKDVSALLAAAAAHSRGEK